MNFKQFLQEESNGIKRFEKIREIIQKDCFTFLKESKGIPLYRGSNLRHADEIVDGLYKGETASKRNPIDSGDYYSIFEPAFEKVYGIKNIRSEHAAFTTGDYDSAEIYSNIVNLFFPIGNYTYWWSPYVYTGYHLYHKDFDMVFGREENSEINAFATLLKNAKYTNTNLSKGIDSTKEIIFKVKEYYLIPVNDLSTYEINELMEYLISGI